MSQLRVLLKRRLFEVPNCRREEVDWAWMAIKVGREAVARVLLLRVLRRMWEVDCFESRVGVASVRVQFIEASVVFSCGCQCELSGGMLDQRMMFFVVRGNSETEATPVLYSYLMSLQCDFLCQLSMAALLIPADCEGERRAKAV